MRTSRICILLLLVMILFFVWAATPVAAKDTGRIEGQVTHVDGGPLAAVTVSVNGTSAAAVTDRKGQFVLKRIVTFQKRQEARSLELQRQGRELEEKKQAIPAEDQLTSMLTLTPEQATYMWDARVFQDREQNLTMACEIPVLIEQRAYQIGRLIRAQMSS